MVIAAKENTDAAAVEDVDAEAEDVGVVDTNVDITNGIQKIPIRVQHQVLTLQQLLHPLPEKV